MASTKEPGPKPDFIVIEDALHATTKEGEIIIDLRVPIKKLEIFMQLQDLDIPEKDFPRYMLDNILDPAETASLENMRDGAKALEIIMQWAKAVGDRLGASMGESQGSTDSSESTEEPSATTSDTDSESASTKSVEESATPTP